MKKAHKRWVISALLASALLVAGWVATRQAELPPLQDSLPAPSAQVMEEGRRLVAMGDCAVCHTAPGGATNAGGLPLESPFGAIYSTNITPDKETGIGLWTYEAFERSMRKGISRDGHYLYPAFPYTSFTRTSDEDLKKIYAYLMSQQPIQSEASKTALPFPFNIRQGIAAWNWMFLEEGAMQNQPTQTAEWNRGAYLTEGLGHCSACHSPRNALFGEKHGADHLNGGLVDGWEAPPLNNRTPSPMAWTQADLRSYLSRGFSPRHGVAAGPMAPIIAGLSEQTDADLNAITTYLLSVKGDQGKTDDPRQLMAAQSKAAGDRPVNTHPIFDRACVSCHAGAPDAPDASLNSPYFGLHPQLAFNTNLHAASPRNLIRIVLDGLPHKASAQVGTMPSFRHSLDDTEIATLLNAMRSEIGLTPWPDLQTQVRKIRQETAAAPQ